MRLNVLHLQQLNGASDPLHVWFKARYFWIGGSNGAISGSIESKMAADGHLGYTKNDSNFATGLPIDVMFSFKVGFSAELRFLP